MKARELMADRIIGILSILRGETNERRVCAKLRVLTSELLASPRNEGFAALAAKIDASLQKNISIITGGSRLIAHQTNAKR
jgi:hypothetical protein